MRELLKRIGWSMREEVGLRQTLQNESLLVLTFPILMSPKPVDISSLTDTLLLR